MTAKQNPCTECSASGRQPHGRFCSIGRARSAAAKKNQANRRQVSKPAARRKRRISVTVGGGGFVLPEVMPQITRTAFVVDRSGSMQNLLGSAISALNGQIDTVKSEAARTSQPAYASVYHFGSDVCCLFRDQYVHSVQPIGQYDIRIAGMTALMDATAMAMHDLKNLPDANDPNVSFLVVVLTDGKENVSRIAQRAFVNEMARLNGTDRWTFVFSGPRGSREYLTRLGIPIGNIQEWDQTEQGVADMTFQVNTGIGTYMTQRSKGVTRSTTFFQVDMSQVNDGDIRKMSDVSSTFRTLKVDNAAPGGTEWLIREFVEDRMDRNKTFARKVSNNYGAGLSY